MQEYERYITVQEAAERLSRTEAEIWRMLETGALPAILRAELSSNDGTPIEYGFALLQPEDVARVVDQGGDDCRLEWKYCGGHGNAIYEKARQSAIRVLWEPSIFPELMPQSEADVQAATDHDTVAGSASNSQDMSMKKKALIAALEYEWRSIEADLSEASRNGLSAAAHAGKHGYWNKARAREWAISKGKIREAAQALQLGMWNSPKK